jgi:hypothetical protein
MNDVYIQLIGRRETKEPAGSDTKEEQPERLRRLPMKTILASIIALGLFAGAASASTTTPVHADNSVTGYCNPYYYGH